MGTILVEEKQFNEIAGLKQQEEFNLDSLINCMSKYSINELCFMRDCIDFMIIYNKHK